MFVIIFPETYVNDRDGVSRWSIPSARETSIFAHYKSIGSSGFLFLAKLKQEARETVSYAIVSLLHIKYEIYVYVIIDIFKNCEI